MKAPKIIDRLKFTAERTPGGAVHDLRIDGGLPPGFQKGALF